MSMKNEVRKFTDDDFRAAVVLLERMEFDVDATVQLIIVTDAFRGLLGAKSKTTEEHHGECVKAS